MFFPYLLLLFLLISPSHENIQTLTIPNRYNQSMINQMHLARIRTKREFIQPQKISKHLKCCICHEVFQDPVRTVCGHTFCYICIENWANLKKNCPLCKQSIKKRKLEKDLIAYNIIDDLQSRCMHENCHWEGEYSQLKKHQRWCEFKPKKQIESIPDAVEVESYQQQSSSVVQICTIYYEPSHSSHSNNSIGGFNQLRSSEV